MSLNWVMLSERGGFTPLQGEQRLYESPARTALSVQSLNKFPGKQPWSIQSSGGCVHLTNRRIVYLPSSATTQLQSFAAPLLNLHDTHVTAPFFGPNVWTAVVQPVAGGGIPPEHPALELKMTFKEGGAFDFHTKFERVKERLMQAVDVARESGQAQQSGSQGGRGGGGNMAGVNLETVNLEDLPAYSATGPSVPVSNAPRGGNAQAQTHMHAALAGMTGQAASSTATEPTSVATSSPPEPVFTPPDEPPPGYDESLSRGVSDELEQRLRDGAR